MTFSGPKVYTRAEMERVRTLYHAAEGRLMRPEAVAAAVTAAVTADPRSVIEEIVLRPVLGDL